MNIVPQISTTVKTELYQPNSDRADLLRMADGCLELAQQYRAQWLTTENPQAWQLWRACLADREELLSEVGRP